MNKEVFEQITKKQNVKEEFLPLLFSEKDDVLIVLKIHLLLENLVDAWVCSFAGKVNFLDFPSKLNFSFSQKLKLAKNMGLPESLYSTVNEINKLRNRMSHDLSKKKIEEGDIEKISKPLGKYKYRFTKPENVSFSDSRNNREYKIGDSYTPDYMKLCIIYFVLQLEFPGVFIPRSKNEKLDKVNLEIKLTG